MEEKASRAPRTWKSGRYSPRPLRLWQPVPVPGCFFHVFMRQVLRLLVHFQVFFVKVDSDQGILTSVYEPLVCAVPCSVFLGCLRSFSDILSTSSLFPAVTSWLPRQRSARNCIAEYLYMAAYIVLFSGAFFAATMEDHSFFRRRVCHLDLVRVCRLRNTCLWIFWEMTSGACRHLLGSTVDTFFCVSLRRLVIVQCFLREGRLAARSWYRLRVDAAWISLLSRWISCPLHPRHSTFLAFLGGFT